MVHPLEDGTELGCCCEGENMTPRDIEDGSNASEQPTRQEEERQMADDYEIASRIAQNALEQCLERPLSLQEKDAVRWLLGLPEKAKTYSDGGQFFMSL